MSTLTVSGVSKRFGDTLAVDGVSLDVGDDEIVALVGPSGCGKSTLLRTIAGLHRADDGSITIAGTPVDDGHRHLPPERRHVGLVFQEHALFPHLTVDGNVGFGVRDGNRRDVRIAEALTMVGLADHGRRYPHELSGGERQRVALARALAPRPALMLLDEPFASLDPNLRTKVRDDVVEILRHEEIPAVFVTHDQQEALGIGDRVAVMRDGRFEQLDTPEQVFHAPVNRFVAGFMGEATFLPVGDDGSTEVGAMRLADGPGPIVMLRPDDVTFQLDSNGPGVVTHAEFRGAHWRYTIELDSGTTVWSQRSHLWRVDIGERVTVGLTPGHQPVLIPD